MLVEDNGPIHTSKRSLAALAARAHWLTVEWLPKYAPELNEIEPVWRDLKAHHLAPQTFTDVAALDQAIHDAVIDLNQRAHPRSVGHAKNLCLGEAHIEILPVRIRRLDQRDLPRARSALDLFLAGDRLVHAFIAFVENRNSQAVCFQAAIARRSWEGFAVRALRMLRPCFRAVETMDLMRTKT